MAKRKAAKSVKILLPPTEPVPGLVALFIRSMALSILFAFILITFSGLLVLGYLLHKSTQFTTPAQASLVELVQIAKTGWQTVPQQDKGRINFLVLGSDELPNRDHQTVLTDTMLIASLNLQNGQVGLYSFPRDIWITTYQEKINKLYESGKQLTPSKPEQLPTKVVEDLSGIPIHHTVIMKLDTLSKLVDLVGGVDVIVKESFTDPLFPRSDVDVTVVHDPKLLYETVSFASGSAHMSGSEVLKYVRSRHAVGEQGSDNARGSRQQDVILALVQKLKDQTFWYDLHRDGLIYHFYMTEFNQYLPVTEAIGIGKLLRPHLSGISFSEGTPGVYPTDQQGTIYHPEGSAAKYFGAWVYEIKDQQKFKDAIRTSLGYGQ